MTFFLFLEGQLTQQNSQANTITKHIEIRVFPPPPVDDAPCEHSLVLYCIDFGTAVYRGNSAPVRKLFWMDGWPQSDFVAQHCRWLMIMMTRGDHQLKQDAPIWPIGIIYIFRGLRDFRAFACWDRNVCERYYPLPTTEPVSCAQIILLSRPRV